MKIRIITLVLALVTLVSALCLVSCKDDEGDKMNDKYLKLVNKQNTIGADYLPENLVSVDTAYTTGGKAIKLEKTTMEAAIKMLDDMKKAGIDNVSITSGYREYSYQKTLFDRYFANEKAEHPDWSDEAVKAQVLTYSAYPGTSEHQTGLCMDLFTTEMEGLWNYGSETPNNPYDKGFAETEAFAWLQKNAHKYGFILRFPDNKTGITGYSYESWHYRYVGEEHAKKIHEKGITLEEYLEN